jgi:Tol biopolymer transport system component
MRLAMAVVAVVTLAGVAASQPVVPELFGEGLISTPDFELNAAFTPDGETVYFTKSTPNMSFWTIVYSRMVNGRWIAPEVAPFSGEHSDADPAITPDGERLVFISRRPVPDKPGRPVPHIWYVDWTGAGWTEPRNAGALNSEAGEYYPSVAADGTLYFESGRAGGSGRADVYRSRLVNGVYSEPEHLGRPLNSEFNEGDAVIAPDQSFIILTITGRPDDLGLGDLYISEQKDGVWTIPRHLPTGINSEGLEFCPSLSPDGNYLYFTSTRGLGNQRLERPLTYRELMARLHGAGNGLGDVYRVPMTVVRPVSAK